MNCRAIASQADLELAYTWLVDPENAKWYDFGSEPLSLLKFRVMVNKKTDVYRLFSFEESQTAIALAVLSDVNLLHRSAHFWMVLGTKEHRRRGYALRIVHEMMKHAFVKLQLNTLHAFLAAPNVASLGLIQKAGWICTGRQRKSYWMDGGFVDRLNVDILREEYLALAAHEHCEPRLSQALADSAYGLSCLG